MKLFEAAWKERFTFFERYYDTELKKSFKSEIKIPYEWYEPSSKGLYTYFLDPSIRLDKKQNYNPKMGRDQYGFLDPIYRNIRDNYWNCNGYNLNPRIAYLDIETRSRECFPKPEEAKEEICMIQIYDNYLNTVIMFGLRDWIYQNYYEFEYPVKYLVFDNEIDLINAHLEFFKKTNPLIIYAWNLSGFDYPYMYNRFKNLGIDPNQLSNYGKATLTQSEFQGQTEFKYNADGHYYIDLMDVYKKFILKPRSSYSLDNIAEVELGERKVQHPEYAKFDDFYTGKYIIPERPTEEQKNSKIYQEAVKNGINNTVRELAHSEFCFYSYRDPILIYKIDKKLNLTKLMLMIAEKMGVQLSDALGTVKPWSQYLANKSILNNQVMPIRTDHKHPDIVGGYVREPEVGKHEWVLSVDVNSMYPMLGMVGFNMSPETFIPKAKLPPDLRDIVLQYFNNQNEQERLQLLPDVWKRVKELLHKYNYSMGINGAVFDNSKIGVIPELVQDIYNSRKQSKITMFDYQKRKVLIKDIIHKKTQE